MRTRRVDGKMTRSASSTTPDSMSRSGCVHGVRSVHEETVLSAALVHSSLSEERERATRHGAVQVLSRMLSDLQKRLLDFDSIQYSEHSA